MLGALRALAILAVILHNTRVRGPENPAGIFVRATANTLRFHMEIDYSHLKSNLAITNAPGPLPTQQKRITTEPLEHLLKPMKYFFRLLKALGIVLIMLLSFSPLQAGEPLKLRSITVRVVADNSFRAAPNWERSIHESVNAVSDIYEKNFQIRFSIVDIIPWYCCDESLPSKYLLPLLSKKVDRGNAELLIGYSHKKCDSHYAGWAHAFGGEAVILTGCIDKVYVNASIEKILSHEIAHLFGAFHIDHRIPSVMTGGPIIEFDSQTARVIRLMRMMDFSKGITGVSHDQRRTWSSIYAEGHINVENEGNLLASAIARHASDLKQQGRIKDAIAAFREAIQLDPNLSAAYSGLGSALVKSGKPDEAKSEFQKAIRLDQKSGHAHAGLGGLMAEQRAWNEAFSEFRYAIQMEPYEPVIRYNYGIALQKRNMPEQATFQFREAIRLDQDFAEAYADLGVALGMQGKLSDAVLEFKKAIQLNPKAGTAYGNLGYTFAQLGKWDEAIAAYQEALRINPDDRNSQVNLRNATVQKQKMNQTPSRF